MAVEAVPNPPEGWKMKVKSSVALMPVVFNMQHVLGITPLKVSTVRLWYRNHQQLCVARCYKHVRSKLSIECLPKDRPLHAADSDAALPAKGLASCSDEQTSPAVTLDQSMRLSPED